MLRDYCTLRLVPTSLRAYIQRGRRRGVVLSQQVRALIGEGNQAYVDANYPETIRIMQEVIRIEPRAAAAWSVLAQCHDEMGEAGKALQLRIMAAHLNHDADEWAELAKQSRQVPFTSLNKHVPCRCGVAQVIRIQPAGLVLLWEDIQPRPNECGCTVGSRYASKGDWGAQSCE